MKIIEKTIVEENRHNYNKIRYNNQTLSLFERIKYPCYYSILDSSNRSISTFNLMICPSLI